MSDRDLFDAVARNTGESNHEIARRGFVLTGPEDAGSTTSPAACRRTTPGSSMCRRRRSSRSSPPAPTINGG